MDIFDEPIDAEQYQLDSDSFEVIDRDSSPYLEIAAQLEHRFEGQEPTKFWLQGSDGQRKSRIVYTIGLDLSECSDLTVPIFEVSLPGAGGFREDQQYRGGREDGMSAYVDRLRSLFVEEDHQDRVTGLGPIGKCLLLSQERDVILFLKGIDRVPGRAQSMFFSILERRPKIQYGGGISGDPENLTICSTTGETANPEDLDRKLRSILGTAHSVEPDSSDHGAFYWVNQNDTDELEREYLRSRDTKWQRDLTVLEPGDAVFHYTDQALRAVSVVVSDPYQDEHDGEQHYFVDLTTEWFDEPVPLAEVSEPLQKPSIRQEQSRYPINKNGGVIQAYLCHLTPAAGAYLLDIADASIPETSARKRYFWVNAADTGWHEPGGESFYPVESSDGTDRRNQEAYERARPGDEALLYRVSTAKQVVGRARVEKGLYEEVPEGHDGPVEGITFRWVESLDGARWSEVSSDPELADSDLVTSDNSYYITELTEREYDRILALGEMTRFEDYEEELAVPAEEMTVEQGDLHFPDGEWERLQSRIEQALVNGNHVLLFGPPGTGKTKLARQVCEATVGEDQYELVTASADWSTFDTVGGYQTTAENTLAFKPGVVLDRFQADADGTPANEWLIIDELNRADIDKAFGSLFSALTGESVTLPFEGSAGEPIEIVDASRGGEVVDPDRYFMPEDWRMLATMNTLDKTSLYEMSYAFMRRWAFIPVGIPEFPQASDEDGDALAALVEAYVKVWAVDGSVPEAGQHYEPIGRIWRAVNQERAIGPAIVEDIYEHVASTSSEAEVDYVSPLIMYVFPQLEGLRRAELERLLERLDSIVDDETGELWEVARDFFQVDLQPGDGE